MYNHIELDKNKGFLVPGDEILAQATVRGVVVTTVSDHPIKIGGENVVAVSIEVKPQVVEVTGKVVQYLRHDILDKKLPGDKEAEELMDRLEVLAANSVVFFDLKGRLKKLIEKLDGEE